jgi:hypothetical protein
VGFDTRRGPQNVVDPGVHMYPIPIIGFYNMNSSDSVSTGMDAACPPAVAALYPGRKDVCIVRCDPPEACLGDNVCAPQYISDAPYFRCATCAPGFYKRATTCVKCPDSIAAVVVVAILIILGGGGVAYFLNKARINIACECAVARAPSTLLRAGMASGRFWAARAGRCAPAAARRPAPLVVALPPLRAPLTCRLRPPAPPPSTRVRALHADIAIAIDYFQILAIFALSKVQWPAAIQELFHVLSAFNLNIEIVAPECLIPKLSYLWKWLFIMAVPLFLQALFALVILANAAYASVVMGRKTSLAGLGGSVVASVLMIMYIMYIYLTRNILDVFNCAPSASSAPRGARGGRAGRRARPAARRS